MGFRNFVTVYCKMTIIIWFIKLNDGAMMNVRTKTRLPNDKFNYQAD